MLPALAPSISVPTITTGTDLIPYNVDSQGNDMPESGEATGIPTKMSPMDSLKAIFEDIRDGINELVVLTREAMPNTRDIGISAADVDDVPAPQENDSQGNKFELPEIGPKTGLGLMLVGLAALFAFGDEIAKAIEPVLKVADKVIETLGVKGALYTGLGLLAAIKFGPALLTLLGTGAKSISAAFTILSSSFAAMRTFVMTTAPNAILAAYGGAKGLLIKAFDTLKLAFTAMRLFILEKMIPAIASAYGGVKGKLMTALTNLGKAFTAMRLFLVGTMIPTITAFMAPFIVPLALLTAAVAAAVAIFTSIKAGIDEFKKSLEEGDSMLVAIIEGVSTALLTLVTLPITLIKNFVAWVAEKLGFEGIAEKLKEFNIVDFIKDGVKNLVLKAKDFVLGLFDIDFQEVLGKFIDIGKSIGTVLKAIAKGSIAAVKAAFPGGESPMEAFKRVYAEVSGGQEGRMPTDAEEAIDSVDKKTDEQLKAEQQVLENELAESTTSQLSGTMTQADLIMQQEIVSALEKINRELDERARMAAEQAAFNNIITTQDNSTNVSSNSMNVTDFSVDGTDQVAKQLANVGQGSY